MTRNEGSTSTEAEIARRAASYESINPAQLNAWFEPYIPHGFASILDVGAGSGRDAAWLASKGHRVVAVEPSSGMRKEAERFHPGPEFTLFSDRLPDLAMTCRTGLSFDLILLNAVWMFIPEAARERSFRKLIALLKPRGVIALSLRTPGETHRGMHPVFRIGNRRTRPATRRLHRINQRSWRSPRAIWSEMAPDHHPFARRRYWRIATNSADRVA